ncbi:hypothetical protein Slala03_71940 [Streptomyces lavendulae subsp. lavendulae]|uniref:hypothetical protein n=1 Tax=Streptomyces lavendulae TaxID=1914 RepID=UPI0024A1CB35|nr:hypothetical protein [Streptomyces lavendulae]GLV87505.1 hypothetical protein Slala03_71940 [Streptomyces lavendulae subsp. lavendulae]
MAAMLITMQQDVLVVDRMFGLVDEACVGEGLPNRPPGSDWAHASPHSVFLETADMLRARLRVEVWDGSADIEEGYWPDQVCMSLALPTARFLVHQSDAGWDKGPHLPSPGRWRLRTSRREAPEELPWEAASGDGVEACFLLQFWPDDRQG